MRLENPAEVQAQKEKEEKEYVLTPGKSVIRGKSFGEGGMKALDNNENNEILEENAENQDELVLDEDIELDKDMNTKVTEEYDASQIQVLEGLEGGPQAPRYVHRLDGSARPAPPCV